MNYRIVIDFISDETVAMHTFSQTMWRANEIAGAVRAQIFEIHVITLAKDVVKKPKLLRAETVY